jgi:putative membrane-bound dehydrogenase-like protein
VKRHLVNLRRLGYAVLVCHGALAAEPVADPDALPRIPPVEPARALATFEVKRGFHLELVASEPLVVDPIAASFDEDGRLYVVEMRDYSERRDERLGRVRRLVDTDGDGRYDQSTVFVDGLPWPTGLIFANGGVFVAATPDLWFCKDTNGDGVADVKQVVFTGFASDFAPYQTNKLNVQALLNSLNWGLDNRIHGAASFSGGHVKSPASPGAAEIELRGRDFSFDPRTLLLRTEAGGGQYGLSFDDAGRKFLCSNSDHIQVIMYESRYGARNPFFSMPAPRVSIAVDGPAAEVYRLSPEEPWRVLRTRWRVNGLVPGPIEGGGRASGYFTSATGLTVFRGNAWPEEYRGDVFIADCGSNLIHRKKLRPDGVALKAERPADEQKTEFVRSRDVWFRPVQMANAPDGALYILDMYREVIEHPWSLPQSIKKHLDLNSGNDRGRIYRLVPDGFHQPKLPHLSTATTRELVATLEHPNGWHRDTAARLIFERQNQAAAPLLEELLRASASPLARMHALHALAGLGALAEGHLLRGLADGDGLVRRHTVRLAEEAGPDGKPSAALAAKLVSLAGDPDPLLRYQLAFTLGSLAPAQKVSALTAIMRRDHDDPWVRAAVLDSLAEGAGDMFLALAAESALQTTQGGQALLRELVGVIAAHNQPAELERVLALLTQTPNAEAAFGLANAFMDGLARASGSLAKADPQGRLQPLFRRAASVAREASQPEAVRAQAVQLLGGGPADQGIAFFVGLVDTEAPPAVHLAALNALARSADASVAGELLRRWDRFTPRLRDAALLALLKRPERVKALLEAITDGPVRATDLSAPQREFLRKHPDAGLRRRALEVLGESGRGHRQEVVDRFLPVLQLAGNAARGQRTFTERCASCHRLGGQGFVLGPDLATVKNSGKEKMLTSILDPNREVAPNYLNYVVETKAGDSLIGLIVSESAASVTVRRAYGEESVVPRNTIARLESQGLSPMPEEIEAGLTPQDLADLLEFVVSADAAK